MQVTVRFGRKAGANPGRIEGGGGVVGGRTGVAGPAALGMLAGSEVGFDDIPDEIGGGCCFWLGGAAHGKNLCFQSRYFTGWRP
jgi:hypothetical protein